MKRQLGPRPTHQARPMLRKIDREQRMNANCEWVWESVYAVSFVLDMRVTVTREVDGWNVPAGKRTLRHVLVE